MTIRKTTLQMTYQSIVDFYYYILDYRTTIKDDLCHFALLLNFHRVTSCLSNDVSARELSDVNILVRDVDLYCFKGR